VCLSQDDVLPRLLRRVFVLPRSLLFVTLLRPPPRPLPTHIHAQVPYKVSKKRP